MAWMGMLGSPGRFKKDLGKSISHHVTKHVACRMSHATLELVIPENAGRDITTTANRDHKVRVELLQNSVCRLLAQFVHLIPGEYCFFFFCCLVLVCLGQPRNSPPHCDMAGDEGTGTGRRGAYLVVGNIEFLGHLGDWKTNWEGNRENEQMKRARARKSKKQNPEARKIRIGAVIVRGVAYLRPRSGILQ